MTVYRVIFLCCGILYLASRFFSTEMKYKNLRHPRHDILGWERRNLCLDQIPPCCFDLDLGVDQGCDYRHVTMSCSHQPLPMAAEDPLMKLDGPICSLIYEMLRLGSRKGKHIILVEAFFFKKKITQQCHLSVISPKIEIRCSKYCS